MFNPRYQNTKYYLQRQRKQMNLNLKTNDIKGTIGMTHAEKLQHKMEIAKMNRPIQKKKDLLTKPKNHHKTQKKREYIKTNENLNRSLNQKKYYKKKNVSANHIPNYKYNGKREKKNFYNKFDGRFNVKDINAKKTKIWPWEENKKNLEKEKMGFRKEKLGKYLPRIDLGKKMDFENGRKVKSVRKEKFGNFKDESFLKQTENFKDVLRKEAHVKFMRNQVTRNIVKKNEHYDRRYPARPGDTNTKRGYKK